MGRNSRMVLGRLALIALIGACVEEFLQQAKLSVSTDERRLENVAF